MTNLGSLTTTFTPIGPDCSSTFIGDHSGTIWVQYGVGAAASLPCLPSGFIPFDPYYYSPGLCPSGYTTACFVQASATGYTCRQDRGTDPFPCLSCFLGPRTFAVSIFSFLLDSTGATTKINAGTTTVVQTDDCVRAYGPVVHRVTNDFIPATATIPWTTDSINTYGISTATVTRPIATGIEDNDETTKGLTIGASVGLGVGSGLAVILIIGVVFFLFRLRRRKLKSREGSGQASQPHPSSIPEQCNAYNQEQQQPPQLQQTGWAELSAERPCYELYYWE
ncbi:hypothetical protein F5Y07DRAFT_394646 [Xylaria sp. FL0933]|nr:hypothetical protein F5Y07DRAFT_394646 [Xylaria sp. FL0933]